MKFFIRVIFPILAIAGIIYFVFIGRPVNVVRDIGEINKIVVFATKDKGKSWEIKRTISDKKTLNAISDLFQSLRMPVNRDNWTLKTYRATCYGNNGEKTISFSKDEIQGIGPMPSDLYNLLLTDG